MRTTCLSLIPPLGCSGVINRPLADTEAVVEYTACYTATNNGAHHLTTKRGPVAGTEEARHGGQAVKAKYGPDSYARIG